VYLANFPSIVPSAPEPPLTIGAGPIGMARKE